MKIYIYEPDGIQSGTALNISARFNHIVKALSDFKPVELRKIQERRDNKTIEKLDISSNLIIAHYTDVVKHRFHELKAFSNAITIFHTYDSSWYPEKIASNPICKGINNGKNRFCVGSTELKENIEGFVNHFISTGEISFEILEGSYPEK